MTTLGFIGSGMIGTALARLAVAADIDVVMSNSRGPETLADLVTELGERARASTPAEVAKTADIVVVTIPLGGYLKLPADELAGRVVLETMNYYPERDGEIAELEGTGLPSSVLVQQRLAGARVVKAVNNIDFHHLSTLARPAGDADRSALPIAGDDEEAKAQVAELLSRLGYDTVDVGGLAESWRSQPDTPVYVDPYLTPRPDGLSDDEVAGWFFKDPGHPLSTTDVSALLAQAARA